MKRKRRISAVVTVLALGLSAAPVEAVVGAGFSAGWNAWPALWQRAVCLVEGRCADSNGGPTSADWKGGPRSIFAEHGMCIDPNGSPSLKACAEIQILEPRVNRDR